MRSAVSASRPDSSAQLRAQAARPAPARTSRHIRCGQALIAPTSAAAWNRRLVVLQRADVLGGDHLAEADDGQPGHRAVREFGRVALAKPSAHENATVSLSVRYVSLAIATTCACRYRTSCTVRRIANRID